MARVSVYIDGFNLYYRALRKTPHKWLNLYNLSANLLDASDNIVSLNYYTARISPRPNNPNQPKRQQLYLSALTTLPNMRICYGSFLSKTKTRPLVGNETTFVEVHDTEEKGSDVNLATHIVHDGWRNMYDVALVFSQDTDLLEPLRIVKNELGKIVCLVWLDGRQPSKKWYGAISSVKHLTKDRLAAAQFPDTLLGRSGRPVHKPESW